MAIPFILGVGASAGGLEALVALLSAPVRSDLAIIIVQHLSPDYKSRMVELLASETSFVVERAVDGAEITGGHVYVIEPQTTLAVRAGTLVVRPQERANHLHLPVDLLLQSLADDQGANAGGVILSGTGSDGTRGCRAIKELGGLVIAQNGESSAFDGMPRSIRTAGLADLVLPPSSMLSEVGRILDGGGLIQEVLDDDRRLVIMNRILAILKRDAAVDFGHYKPATIVRRVKRRLGILGISSEDYASRLETDAMERELLVRDMLIGVTRFFRDWEAFETLVRHLQAYCGTLTETCLRVWVAGCSTGEEAYSVAILVSECLRRTETGGTFKVFATDINQEALRTASAGVYGTSAMADVPDEYLTRYFERNSSGTFVAKSELREHILFSRHNVFQDAPFSGLDLVVCRNLLIYLRSAVQERVCQNFAFSLRKGGLVLLGPSESPPNAAGDFELVDPRWQLFACVGRSKLATNLVVRPRGNGAADTIHMPTAPRKDIELLDIYRTLLPTFVPPFIAIDLSFLIVYRSGNLGGLLRVPDGRGTLDVRQMLPDAMAPMLSRVSHELQTHSPVKVQDVRFVSGDTEFAFDILAHLIRETSLGRTLMVLIFQGLSEAKVEAFEITLPSGEFYDQQRLRDLEEQLNASKENLQAMVDALESTNEELQATNEELLASNEELQSLNEELQSVNEELHTVNAEYQIKIEELSRLNLDMDQLLSSIDIGALFVDSNLGIRRFNAPAARFISLLEQDVGRPLSHLHHDFGDAPLLDICAKTLRSAESVERLLVSTGGSRVLFRARCLSAECPDDGLVLTFTDVTSVHLERESRQLLDEALQSADVPIALLDREGRITLANAAFATQFDRDAKWLTGVDAAQLLSDEERSSFRAQVEVSASVGLWHGVVHSLKADGSLFQECICLAPLRNESGESVGLLRFTERTFELGRVDGAAITGTYTWDIRTDESLCSASLYDVVGMDREGPKPSMKSFYPKILEEDRDNVDRQLAIAMDSLVPHEFSFRARRSTGEVQRVGSRMLPDRLPTGELRRMIGVMWVIHEGGKAQAAAASS